MINYGVLVNTCDPFSDCWGPYFKLHKKFWPDCSGKLYLNTEAKNYSYDGLDITSLQVSEGYSRRLTWSECLLKALDKIEEDYVLYMQEDYFLKDYVKNEEIESLLNIIDENNEIDCIHLTDQAVKTGNSSSFSGLVEVIHPQRYYVSCQAGIWRKSSLKKLILTHESAWEFEEFGSKRAHLLRQKFYAVNPKTVKINQYEIIPYIFTGIIQGRWKYEVVNLFDNNNIQIDYSIRGFVSNAPKRTYKQKLKHRLNSLTSRIKSYLNLIHLYFTNSIQKL